MKPISFNAEREIGKAFINIFYLVVIGVFVTFTINNGTLIDIAMAFYFTTFAISSLLIGASLITNADKREEEYKKRETNKKQNHPLHTKRKK